MVETCLYWNINIISGHLTIIVTYIHMDIAIVVCECGRGRKCLYTGKLTYIYALFRQMEMQEEEEDRRMSKAICTSIGTFFNWSIQIIRGYYRIVETYTHMSTAINVYEYARGGKCVYMFGYTYAGIREMKMQMEKEDRHMRKKKDMGWLRLVGSLKLQVSFAKEPYKRDDILQKRPIILRSLLIVATP